MEEQQLKQLLSSLSLIEKVGQLVQLSGEFFKTDSLVVGPLQKLGISEEILRNVGSVLNIAGSKKLMKFKKNI